MQSRNTQPTSIFIHTISIPPNEMKFLGTLYIIPEKIANRFLNLETNGLEKRQTLHVKGRGGNHSRQIDLMMKDFQGVKN